MMRIPRADYEVKWHTPGTPVDYSVNGKPKQTGLVRKIGNTILDGLPFKIRLTTDAAVARRTRAKLIYLSQKAADRSATCAPSLAPVLQAAPGDARWAKENGECANEALRAVRLALYSKKHGSFKSTNKFSLKRIESERVRLTQGKFAVMNDPSAVNRRHYAALRSKNIWESTHINCDGLTAAAMDYVSHRHPRVPVSLGGVPEHAFAIIGAVKPEYASLTLDKWPSHLYVCDPWANIACSAPEYPDKFMEKMKKWHDNGKLVLTRDGTWISPQNPKLLYCVKNVPRVIPRIRYADGQYEYGSPLATAPQSTSRISG